MKMSFQLFNNCCYNTVLSASRPASQGTAMNLSKECEAAILSGASFTIFFSGEAL